MITVFTITSLDQGKELAHRQVAKLFAEPAEPACEVTVEEFVRAGPRRRAPQRRSVAGMFIPDFFRSGIPRSPSARGGSKLLAGTESHEIPAA